WELPMFGPKADAAIQQARIAARRVMQPELEAALAALSGRVARRRGQWDEAFRIVEIELAGYRAHGLEVRQLRAVIGRNTLRIARAEPGDLRAIAGDIRVWRPIAVAHHRLDLARLLEAEDARARLLLGDVASAHADLVRLWQARPHLTRTIGARRITGEVVDSSGRPVTGATVAAASNLRADSVGIGLPVFSEDESTEDNLRIVASDAAGRFAIEDGAREGAIAAQLGDRRSRPIAIADRVTLVLEPTRSVTGKVNLGSTSHTRVMVYSVVDGNASGRFTLSAPVGADGSFAMAGVTTGAFRIGPSAPRADELDNHVEYRAFPASPLPITGITLELASPARTLDIVVRSAVATPIDGAMVMVLAGKHEVSRVDDLDWLSNEAMDLRLARPATGDSVPRPVRDKIRPGDLLAHIEHAGTGELTVCALNLTGDLMDPAFLQRLEAHLSQLAFKCAQLGPDVSVIVLDVPPQQRFD
ncbi:MAG TPA: hypothetical protein VF469_02250, partial [Kofleriaceae bacterium]